MLLTIWIASLRVACLISSNKSEYSIPPRKYRRSCQSSHGCGESIHLGEMLAKSNDFYCHFLQYFLRTHARRGSNSESLPVLRYRILELCSRSPFRILHGLPSPLSLRGFHCLFLRPTPAQVADWVRLLGSRPTAGGRGDLLCRVKEVIHQTYVPHACQVSTFLELPYPNIFLILTKLRKRDVGIFLGLYYAPPRFPASAVIML